MKTNTYYLILIVTMLLSACSTGIAATNQSVESQVTQTAEISPTATVDKQ